MCYNTVMKISEYDPKKLTAVIIIDGRKEIIAEEAAVKSGVDIKKDIDEAAIPLLIEKSREILCKKYLFDQIARYSKTERGYRKKLYEKGYGKPAVDKAIAAAKSYGYIDDKIYAERYFSDNISKKGILRIKKELIGKGISPDICGELSGNIPDQKQTIIYLAAKFMRNRENTTENHRKLFRHLAGKGFVYDQIITVLREITDDIGDEEI